MPEEKTEELWVYLGRRFNYSQGTLNYVWRDPEGNEKWFKKSFSCSVGGIYTATVTREKDGSTTLHGAPKWTGDALEEDEKAALVAKDWQAYREKDFRAREKRANATPALDRVVEDILELIRDYDDISPVMGMIRNRVDKGWIAREKAKAKEKAKS